MRLEKIHITHISFVIFYSLSAFFLFFHIANGATGVIDTSATNQAKVCQDVTCTSPAPGIINFELVAEPSIVVDSTTGISGRVWGSSLGFITMNPTGQGVTFANATTGLLTGKAWSTVSGWVNFNVTGQQVVIDPSTGNFNGWAWTGGPKGGWIKFDCNDASTCVRTTWRPGTSGGGGGGGNSGHPILPSQSPAVDVCPNISNSQQSIPLGYTVDQNGNCVTIVDVCPNLSGVQPSLPSLYGIDYKGACVPVSLDFCPNIEGNQSVIPSNYIVDSSGACVPQPKDFCLNITGVQTSYEQCKFTGEDLCVNLPGFQTSVPKEYVEDSSHFFGPICYPQSFDACPNLPDRQTSIPNDLMIGENGNCVPQPRDICENLAGSQGIVPKGFYQDNGLCFFIEDVAGINNPDIKPEVTPTKIIMTVTNNIGNIGKTALSGLINIGNQIIKIITTIFNFFIQSFIQIFEKIKTIITANNNNNNVDNPIFPHKFLI